jgi:hypothetical protein
MRLCHLAASLALETNTIRNADELTRSGAIITMERSIIERCSDGKQD